MTDKLKPCPFCGCKEIEFSEVSPREEPAPYCYKCGVMTFDVTTWNTRANQTGGMVSKDDVLAKLRQPIYFDDHFHSPDYRRGYTGSNKDALAAIEAMPCSDDKLVEALNSEMMFYRVRRYGGNCRECADSDGFCPNNKLPCDPEERQVAIKSVISAVVYFIEHPQFLKDKGAR